MFMRWYATQGKDINDIKTWRNTEYSGIEAYTAFAKYNHPEPELSGDVSEALGIAVGWMHNQFGMYMTGSSVLSAQQVIDRTEASGSPGYPWNLYHKTCEEFYQSEDVTHLDRYWDNARSLDGSFCIWNSFLKEELRKITKISQGDIRQINGCPVEFKVAMNRYCLDQNELFYKSHLKTASCVGIVKFHGGWNRLYKKLCRHPKGFAMDVKRWDSHFPRCIFEAIARFRFTCLARAFQTREHAARFHNLYEQIIKSATVMSWGEVIQTRLGNPSGSPNTVVDNTLGLYILISYCWIRACQEDGSDIEYHTYQSEVVTALYGDDNTFTASEIGLKLLNPDSVKRFALELGFNVTADSDVPLPVLELDFLSSNFKKLPNGFVVPKPKDPEKAKASLAFRSDREAKTSWSRACSHRINSFYEREIFDIADSYCKHLRDYLDSALGDDLEWLRLKNEYLSELRIHSLYTAAESGSS